jgi:hypothetical protein
MPYVTGHEVFQLPKDRSVAIWRYFDLPKLVALLKDKSLWFAAADRLGDPLEGWYSQPFVAARNEFFSKDENLPNAVEQFTRLSRRMLDCTFVNTWHISHYESAAMWSTYTAQGMGVAVRSTISRLTESLTSDEEDIYVGVVKYIDYETEMMPFGNAMWPLSTNGGASNMRVNYEHSSLRSRTKTRESTS